MRSRIVYAGRGGALPGGPATLFKTVDGGATWTPLSGASGEAVFDIAVDPHDPSRILVAGYQHLFRSVDGGATWESLDLQTGPLQPLFQSVAFDPVTPGVAYAASNNEGFLKSVDGGATWTRKAVLPQLSLLEVSPSGVLVALPVVQFPARVFRSLDQGETWTALGAIADVAIYDLAFSPDGTLFAGTSLGVFRKDAAGAGWTRLRPGQREGTNGGRTWTRRQIPDGECVFPFFLSLDPRRPDDLFVSGSRETACQRQHEDSCHTLSTSEGGASWDCLESVRTNSFYDIVVDPRRSSTLYAAEPARVFKSTDGGQTWTLANSGLPERVINDLLIAPNGTLWAATGLGLFRSADGARTWHRAGRGLPRNQAITELALAPSDPKVLYATIEIYDPEGSRFDLYVSTDRGATWRRLPETGLPDTVYAGHAPLLVDPREPGRIYVGTSLGLYRLDGADEP